MPVSCLSCGARFGAACVVVAALACAAGCSRPRPAAPFSGVMKCTSGPIRIVIYGDSRCRHPLEFWVKDTSAARRKVAHRIAQVRPDIVISTGDMVDRGGSAAAWQVFDEENAWLRRLDIPYFPVIGNHEYMGGSPKRAITNYFARFPYLGRRRWYRLDVGPVVFLMLDSNFSMMSPADVNRQLQWVNEMLDICEQDSRVRLAAIVTHHPPFTHSYNESRNVEVLHYVLPATIGHGKFRLFISGHSHTYERFALGAVNYIVTGGGGARLDVTPAAVFPRDQYGGGEIRGFHYCLMTIYQQECSIEMFELQPDGSWVVRDSLRIRWETPPQAAGR